MERFTYDEQGNVNSIKRSNGTYSSLEYDDGGRLKAVKNFNGAGDVQEKYEYTYNDGNELTSVNGQAYTYDVNGNLTNNGSKTFVYDVENRLTQVKNSSGQTIASFTYDHEGKRNSMTASGTTVYFYYSGDKVIYETDSSNNIIAEYSYDPQGNPATMTKNGLVYYYQVNGHGDVIAMTDQNGATVAQYSYDAYGNILSQSGTMASQNPFRYAGYRYDEATGLYYLMARYYDASIGRFITRDSFQGFEDEPKSLNQYNYAHSNPVKYTDPSGHFVWTVIGGVSVGFLANKIGKSAGLSGWKLALFTTAGVGIGALVGHAMTPLLKPLAYAFVNWGKAVGVVSTAAGYKLMIHWPHHGKGIHIAVQKLTQYGNWRQIFEKTLWK